MGDNAELELCPFCGGVAQGRIAIICPERWCIECDGCGVYIIADTKDEVIEKWNSRIYNSA
jgi:hypothetical protein